MVDSTTQKAANPWGLPAGVPNPGEVLDGKFRVTAVLGAGGMGYVLAAENVVLHQRVAIKFLAPDAARKRDAVERFLREARASVRIRNEHVAQVFDVGTAESGVPYLVMELLDGEDLGSRLERTGPLRPDEAASYVIQACDGLASAHLRGIVHRDLKPSNLFVTRRDDGSDLLKIIDFGIAKAVADDPARAGASLTDTNSILGSPAYMSPEQIRSTKNVDARTDIWSLGVVLYELLTGAVPFTGSTASAVLAAIVADSPAPMPQSTPPELRDVVLRCLVKDPAQRIQSVGVLAMELARHCPAALEVAARALRTAEGSGPSAPPPAPSAPPAPQVGHAALARTVGRTGALRPPIAMTAAIAVALLSGGALAYLLFHASARTKPVADPAPTGTQLTVAARDQGTPGLPAAMPVSLPSASASAVARDSNDAGPAPSASAGKSKPKSREYDPAENSH